jgi:hypothetical protein
MNHGIISGDIIASTSLVMQEKEALVQQVKKLFGELAKKYKVFGRVVKGDQIECYIPDVKQTLRMALILKCFIKSKTDMPFASTGSTHKLSAGNRHFKIHGIRLAIVIGQMNKVDRKKGILDGEAIYTAGRAIDEQHTSNKGRIVIKNSMIFISSNTEWQGEFEVALSLIDILIAKCTAKQSAILVERLYGKTEEEMSALFNISQSAVNQNSNAAGWQGIEKAINRFEKIVHA